MKFIRGLVIWIVSVILLGVPLSVLGIYKLIVVTTQRGRRRRRGDVEELFCIDANDSFFAPDSAWIKSALNFGIILRCKPNSDGKFFTVEELREKFSKCFLHDDMEGGKYGKFFSYLEAKGRHVFRVQQKSIDLDEHIFEVKWDDKNGNSHSLEKMLVKWWLLKWPERKPCWEMILIKQSTESHEELIVAFKIHHALADGYSLIHILDRLTGNNSPYLVRDFDESTSTKIKQMIECAANLGKMGGMPPEQNPFRVMLTNANKYQWMVSFTSFPLDGVKEIRRKHGVHMISVIFAIIIGALRQYAEEDLEAKKIPTVIGFATTLPWPNHPARNPKTPNRDKLCNHWVTGGGKVALDEKDPIVRLKLIENELQTFLDLGLNKFMKRIMIPMMSVMPCSVLGMSAEKDYGMAAGLTSLVGGDNYSLLGCQVERIHPFISVQDCNPFAAISCFTFSHSGRMEMTLGVHPSVFKDQETLNKLSQEFCQNEFNTLMKS